MSKASKLHFLSDIYIVSGFRSCFLTKISYTIYDTQNEFLKPVKRLPLNIVIELFALLAFH